jgi:regulator of sigma E protease
MKPYIGTVEEEYNAYKEGLREGDLILTFDGGKVNNWDDILLLMELKEPGTPIVFEIKNINNEIKEYIIEPTKETIGEEEIYTYGFYQTNKINPGFFEAVKYAFLKFVAIYTSMFKIVGNLITGALSINSLAGPIGIYSIVGQQAALGFENIIYLVAFLSINVGFVNLIPFPAFDGGRVLFLIIEKIRKKAVDVKVENIIHTVGFVLLMILMLVITFKDIKNLIG